MGGSDPEIPRKEAKGLAMPWESDYGYAQAAKVGDTIYLSGQLSHDEQGNFIGPAPSTTRAASAATPIWRSRCGKPM